MQFKDNSQMCMLSNNTGMQRNLHTIQGLLCFVVFWYHLISLTSIWFTVLIVTTKQSITNLCAWFITLSADNKHGDMMRFVIVSHESLPHRMSQMFMVDNSVVHILCCNCTPGLSDIQGPSHKCFMNSGWKFYEMIFRFFLTYIFYSKFYASHYDKLAMPCMNWCQNDDKCQN